MKHLSGAISGFLAIWMLGVSIAVAAQTPHANPVSQNEAWRIAHLQPLEANSRIPVLSPDGRWVVGLRQGEGNEICVWAVATMDATCSPDNVPEGFQATEAAFVWAPDSSAVVLNLVPYSGVDTDIYVLDLFDLRLANLTDDGYDGPVFDPPDGTLVDWAPAWSADSRQIVFSRTEWGVTGIYGVELSLMRIDRNGGEPVVMIPFGPVWPLEVYPPPVWLPDGTLLYAKVNVTDWEEPQTGLWGGVPGGLRGATVSREVHLVPGAAGEVVPVPKIHDVDAARSMVSLLSLPRFIEEPSVSPGPVFWLYDIDDGVLTPLPDVKIDGHVATPAAPAVLSPDGTMALIVYRAGDEGHLVIWDLATGESQVLAHPDLDPRFVQSAWATNGSVLVWNGNSRAVIQLERRGNP